MSVSVVGWRFSGSFQMSNVRKHLGRWWRSTRSWSLQILGRDRIKEHWIMILMRISLFMKLKRSQVFEPCKFTVLCVIEHKSIYKIYKI
jgi:hypothetical protein